MAKLAEGNRILFEWQALVRQAQEAQAEIAQASLTCARLAVERDALAERLAENVAALGQDELDARRGQRNVLRARLALEGGNDALAAELAQWEARHEGVRRQLLTKWGIDGLRYYLDEIAAADKSLLGRQKREIVHAPGPAVDDH